MIPFCCTPQPHRTHTRSLAHIYAPSTHTQSHPTLLFNLGQNLSILEKEVFLQKSKKTNQHFQFTNETKMRKENQRTSSPTLIALPPQPGNRTLSPALTDVGIMRPSLFGAPGPTAITVASGSGLDVAEVGRNIPVAVFWNQFLFVRSSEP